MSQLDSFTNPCVFRFRQDGRQTAFIEAEELIASSDLQMVLNNRSRMAYRRPLVVHFPDPSRACPIRFGFSFELEILAVGVDGVVEKVYRVPANRRGDALNIQFFSGYDSVILVYPGFSNSWRVEPFKTTVRRLRLAHVHERIA